MSAVVNAVCVLRSDQPEVGGIVRLSQDSKGGPTTLTGKVRGLTVGKHGFHVHQFGDLSNGCTSAGSHFNPFNKSHGGPDDENRHAGDMGNIQIKSGEGEQEFTIVDKQVSLIGIHSVIGRSLIIHAGMCNSFNFSHFSFAKKFIDLQIVDDTQIYRIHSCY